MKDIGNLESTSGEKKKGDEEIVCQERGIGYDRDLPPRTDATKSILSNYRVKGGDIERGGHDEEGKHKRIPLPGPQGSRLEGEPKSMKGSSVTMEIEKELIREWRLVWFIVIFSLTVCQERK